MFIPVIQSSQWDTGAVVEGRIGEKFIKRRLAEKGGEKNYYGPTPYIGHIEYGVQGM